MHLQSTVTLVGNLVDDVTYRSAGGSMVARFRMACSNGYHDRRTDRWVETTTYLWVSAWRQLGENANASLHKGQPVVVVGRPKQREYESEGRRVTVVDIEADLIGHDLSRGRATFERNRRGPQTADLGRAESATSNGSLVAEARRHRDDRVEVVAFSDDPVAGATVPGVTGGGLLGDVDPSRSTQPLTDDDDAQHERAAAQVGVDPAA